MTCPPGSCASGPAAATADGQPSWEPDTVADYVLSDPTPEEAEAMQAAVIQGTEAVEAVLGEGLESAMNRYNR